MKKRVIQRRGKRREEKEGNMLNKKIRKNQQGRGEWELRMRFERSGGGAAS